MVRRRCLTRWLAALKENFLPTPISIRRARGRDALNARFMTLTRASRSILRSGATYRSACLIRRARRLADAAEYAPQIVYTKHYVIGASHYAYTEDVTDEAYLDFSRDRLPGGQLCLATFMPDGTIKNEVLVSSPTGTIRDPDASWDGKKILSLCVRASTKTISISTNMTPRRRRPGKLPLDLALRILSRSTFLTAISFSARRAAVR